MKNEIAKIEKFIKDYVENSKAKGIVIGMSGGKDSFITAKLCANAIGKENILGVLMPNGESKDLEIAIENCKEIGIRYYKVDISNIYKDIISSTKVFLEGEKQDILDISTINTQPRIRMTLLYAIAGSLNYLVANTSNLSETMIGYTTKWGDNVGDFSPIGKYTKTEVCKIGIELGLSPKYVLKTPDDGLSGKSDEEKIGFTYDELDKFIRFGEKSTNYNIIEKMHKNSKHKRNPISKCENNFKNFFEE